MFRVATVDVHASQVSVIVQDDVERELSCRTCKPEKRKVDYNGMFCTP